MDILRVGAVNTNPTVGAVFSNVENMEKKRDELLEMAKDIDVMIFSEMCVCGYPPEDLVQWPSFIEAQYEALKQFSQSCPAGGTAYIVGAAVDHKDHIYNAAVVIYNNRIIGIVPKEKLPTYSVFYEGRTITAGLPGIIGPWDSVHEVFKASEGVPFGDMTFFIEGLGHFGTEICEDGWTPDGPGNRRSYQGAEVIFNLSASPWRPGVYYRRRRMLGTRSADNAVGFVYSNQIGGNDSLVFDGGVYVYEAGSEIMVTKRWQENVSVFDINLGNIRRERSSNTTWRLNQQQHQQASEVIKIGPARRRHKDPLPQEVILAAQMNAAKQFLGSFEEDIYAVNEIEDMREAILLGMQDYLAKAAPFKAEVISLSGGRDSTLVLIYAAENARRRMDKEADLSERIFCYSLPTQFNSDVTKSIAAEVSTALGVSFKEVPIQATFEEEAAILEETMGHPLTRLARQNLQARLRAARVRTIANSKDALLWQTGSMSEKATGYTTLGGDMEGDYSPLSDVPKTVEELLLWQEYDLDMKRGDYGLAAVIKRILQDTIASAELEEDQDDQSELAPFPVIDMCFSMFFGEKLSYQEIINQIEDRLGKNQLKTLDDDYKNKIEGWVKNCIRRFINSVFKWIQMCQGIHLLDVDLDRERALQIPAVQSLEWLQMYDNKKD